MILRVYVFRLEQNRYVWVCPSEWLLARFYNRGAVEVFQRYGGNVLRTSNTVTMAEITSRDDGDARPWSA